MRDTTAMNACVSPIIASLLMIFSVAASASAEIGKPAPDFTLAAADGKDWRLADLRGKRVVLEWHNPECPFVKKHYGAGNMQKQQADATAAGAIWLTINTASAGKQGHLDAAAARTYISGVDGRQSAYLFDADGSVGHAYGARTTPHMYVIDEQGILRYAGGIDSIASADQDDIATATQFVPQVLAELAAGKSVSTDRAEPYGCSVKYAD